ncbi:type VI secretion system baseplate subunit TssG [Chromobacterium sp. IIBBL 290-4]|uniref:type VI secretion system baseplate subunit TssG n=1 Tax=Chromobacterium sp. IIBBL 290-4 TaxID=2953890 RepID=UPI0020B8AAB8|nr:type VI secretion system baseplate subunit TssG [Chromobacterium sp. IIBBL 290-4]UTH75149.1 type VI secretion system baseplate subunit TssG [Chromobacterium sp. IIBBL 290-4]
MAAPLRPQPGSVAERLLSQPQGFEFAQAVMLLERLNPNAAPLGSGADPSREAVRLRGPLAPLFAASELDALQDDGDGLTLSVASFGLGGPDGPLPYAYQEWLQQRKLAKDPAPAAFLQLFQHRLLSLLYRVRRRYRLAPGYAAPRSSPARPLLLSLCGLLPPGLQSRQAVADAALLARAALLADRRRSLAGFVALARHHFGAPFAAEPFAGGWRDIPPASRSAIGPNGRNARLGQGALAGSRAWDEHAGIRLIIGPLSAALYHSFLPGAERHLALAALAAFYFGLDLDIQLTLRLQAAPAPLRLRRDAAPRLCWDSWLGGGDGEKQLRTRLRQAEDAR